MPGFHNTAKTLSCDMATKDLNLNCIIFWYRIFHEPSLAAAMNIQKGIFKSVHRKKYILNKLSVCYLIQIWKYLGSRWGGSFGMATSVGLLLKMEGSIEKTLFGGEG